MLDLIEIIIGILEMIFDHQSKKEKKADFRKSATHPSTQPVPDSNRIVTSHGGGPASMPYPYTEFDQWHAM